MHVLQRLPVGLDQPGLGVRHAEGRAVGLDQGLGEAQMRSRHAREEMVLDLVVQPAEEPVGEDGAAHVARGEHLPLQVPPAVPVRIGHLHALVVRGEGHAQVQSEERMVHESEDDGLSGRHDREQQGGVDTEVGDQQQGGQGSLSDGLLPQVLEAGDLQGDAFEEQHREEQPGLVAGEPAGEALALRRLLLGPDEGADADVRILVDVVRVGVVAYVLVVPPRLVHAEQEVGVDQADRPAHPPVTGYLGMTGVVPDEGGTGPDDGQGQGEQEGPPGVPEEDQCGDHRAQCEQIGGDACRVPAGAPFEESLPPDGPQQWREVTSCTSGTSGTVADRFHDSGCGLRHDVSGLIGALT